ncbi:MAG: TIGR02117 family protein [Ferruginibacter sp.]
MKKLFKYLFLSLVTFILLILTYLLAAFCLSRITVEKEANATNDVEIYIKTNGVHTDLVMPVRNSQMDWSKEIKFSNTSLNDTSMQLLAVGWGDKGFYLETPTWADLRFKVAFKAAFGLGNTAIHATFYKQLTESESCKKILIGREQYSRLIDYILNSLQKDENGHVKYINTKANYSNTDAFYEANGSYSLFHTCNTWANSGLKISGQKCCLWTPFDTAIFLKYK